MKELIEYLKLDTSPEVLQELAKLIARGNAYKRFKIHREGLRPRQIEEPYPVLKRVQREILNKLDKRFITLLLLPFSYGIKSRYRSVVYHAALHHRYNPPWILSMDIKGFFPTTTATKLQAGLASIFSIIEMSQSVRDNLVSLCMAPFGRNGE